MIYLFALSKEKKQLFYFLREFEIMFKFSKLQNAKNIAQWFASGICGWIKTKSIYYEKVSPLLIDRDNPKNDSFFEDND